MSHPAAIPAIKASEAASIADEVYRHLEGKPVTDESRQNLAASSQIEQLSSLVIHWASLERDPAHSSAYFVAADTADGSSILLSLALASTEASANTLQGTVIGRVRPAGSREVVMTAIPFRRTDRQNVQAFALDGGKAFLPVPRFSSGNGLIVARTDEAANAFAAFQTIFDQHRCNVAGLAGEWTDAVHAALRCGWRRGYRFIGDVEWDSTVDVKNVDHDVELQIPLGVESAAVISRVRSQPPGTLTGLCVDDDDAQRFAPVASEFGLELSIRLHAGTAKALDPAQRYRISAGAGANEILAIADAIYGRS
jgi:hypothetical protein